MQTDTAETIDFADMTTTVRTPAEAAARKALLARQDIAAGIAYDGAMAAGLGLEEAKVRAAKARRETT